MSIFIIPDMTCGHCKATVEKAIHELDAAAVITIDLVIWMPTVQTWIRRTPLLLKSSQP